MDKQAYIDELKFRLTGGVLETELDDSAFNKILDIGLRELQRYICTTTYITVPYSKCINFDNLNLESQKSIKVNSVVRVFRTLGFTSETTTGVTDPMYASQWQLLSGTGNLYNFQDYVYNYSSWNTLLQIRNTTSTDLSFTFDKITNNLYINTAANNPDKITIEYIPRYDSVEDIVSDYWIDVLVRLCVAQAKITVGRIRSRYTQSNALWQHDGQTILDEGKQEYQQLQEYLQNNTQLTYGID